MNREELQKLAESGDTEAQLKLGMNLLKRDENWLFKPGTKLPNENEYEQAIAWFEKAANAGNVNAQAALAFILDGTVVQRLKGGRINKKDEEKSLYWTHQAAQTAINGQPGAKLNVMPQREKTTTLRKLFIGTNAAKNILI